MNLQATKGVEVVLRVTQPFNVRATGIVAALYSPGGTEFSAAPTVVLGEYRLSQTSADYGKGETDPTAVVLADTTGQAEGDFARGDDVVIGLPTYLERETHERGEIARYVHAAAGNTTTIQMMDDLATTYTGGATVGVWSCHHAVTLSATHTATLGANYRLNLVYTLADGSTETLDEYVDVVSRPYHQTLTTLKLRQNWPEIFDLAVQFTATPGGTVERALELAFEEVVREIHSKGFRADLFRDQNVLEMPTAYCAKWKMAQNGVVPSHWRDDRSTYENNTRIAYLGSLKQMLENADYDRDDDLAIGDDEENQAFGVAWGAH